jgi:hypothetical protein
MKIIITENQFNLLLKETVNPCPEGKKEDSLITLDQIKNGSIIEKEELEDHYLKMNFTRLHFRKKMRTLQIVFRVTLTTKVSRAETIS